MHAMILAYFGMAFVLSVAVALLIYTKKSICNFDKSIGLAQNRRKSIIHHCLPSHILHKNRIILYP